MDDDAPVEPRETDGLFTRMGRFGRLILAVSGGADSTALMHLAALWCERTGRPTSSIQVVTIDHRLRPAAAAEAVAVAHAAARHGFAHETLVWDGPKPASGLQEAARTARYDLLHAAAVRWAQAAEHEAVAIVTAHTADDQAETLIMRLARGSGVDGLASIPEIGSVARFGREGRCRVVPVLRPLLGISRKRLLATLSRDGIGFSDDPSNHDERFERVRVREAMRLLATVGVSARAIGRTAARMQSAKSALAIAARQLEASAVNTVPGIGFRIDRDRLAAAPAEIGRRLLSRLIGCAGGAARRPELAAVEAAHGRIVTAATWPLPAFTIGGCIVEATVRACGVAPGLWIYREPDREGGIGSLRLRPGSVVVWDERFRVASAGEAPEVEIGPLGRDLGALLASHPAVGDLELPSSALRGVPAVRLDGVVIAVPTLGRLLGEPGSGSGARGLAGPPRPETGALGEPGLPLFSIEAIDCETQT